MQKGSKHTEESKRKNREAHLGNTYAKGNRGRKYSVEERSSHRKAYDMMIGNQRAKGYTHTEDTKYQMSKKRIGNKNGAGNVGRTATNKGVPDSAKTRNRKRLSAIRRIERNKGQVKPNYNPGACKAIDKYGKQHGYDFQHAENGGEFHIKPLGYWVDGYDAEQNVVIEYDEPRHFVGGKLRPTDVQRQKEITEHLGCTFIRIR